MKPKDIETNASYTCKRNGRTVRVAVVRHYRADRWLVRMPSGKEFVASAKMLEEENKRGDLQ